MTMSMGADQAVAILTQLLENSSPKMSLTNAQLVVFERCWAGESYRAIANDLRYDYDYVKQIGAQLWRSLTQLLGEHVSKSNFRTILLQHRPAPTTIPPTAPHCHWGEAIDATVFFDRATELATLQQWIETDRCRLITILGMGGIGKTALSVKLAEQIVGVKRWGADTEANPPSTSFQFLFWQSLRDAPPLSELLTELLKFFPQTAPLPDNTGAKISALILCLQQHRSLIVLDNFDALLAAGEQSGSYREDLADYGELLQRLAEIPHQSCIVLTSREKPQEIVALAGEAFPVRVLPLQGIGSTAGQSLLAAKGLQGVSDDLNAVIDRYRGNPLALKIAASSIQDRFSGNLNAFLEQGLPYNNINHLLQQQINRLSELELQLMNWLAINREPMSVAELQVDLLPERAESELSAALESLSRRSLIEKVGDGFTQQPVVMEYMTTRLVRRIAQEIVGDTESKIKVYSQKPLNQSQYDNVTESNLPYSDLRQYAIAKATSKDYIRESQTRMLVEPIVRQVSRELRLLDALQNRLYQILGQLRRQETPTDYGVSNLIYLWRYLKVDLTGADFSGAQIRQAYFADLNLQHVNFGEAELTNCIFAETFGGILSIAFSPDGQRLAAADSAGEIRVWDLATNQLHLSFRAHDHWIWSIAFSPDGRLLASTSDDKAAKLWDAETGTCLQVWREHLQSVLAVAFSPNGEWVATSSDDLTIRLRHLHHADRDQVWQNTHDRRVWGLCFSPDSQTLASSSEDRLVKLWQVQTGTCTQTLIGHTDWIRAIAFHPTQPWLVSGSHDRTIYLWQTDGTCLRTFAGHTAAVTAIGFSADGEQIVSSSHDHTLRIWQTATGDCVQRLEGHTNRLWAGAFSPIDFVVASGGDDNSVRLWNWPQGYCTRTFQGHTNAVSPIELSVDRKTLASCHEDATIKLWDCKTGAVVQTLRGHSDRVWTAAFAPPSCGDLMASGSGDQTVKLWNWRSGECLATLSGHDSWVWSVLFHPSQPILASSSYDATIKLWDLEKGICVRTLQGHTASAVGLLFDPEGSWLASCSSDRTIRLWDWQSGECIRVLQGHESNVWQLALHPDRRRIASCSYDQSVKLWDLETGTCLQTLSGHTAPVVTLAFNAAGDRLYSAGFDQTIRVWDLNSGDCIQVLQGHSGIIAGLQVDDRLISSCFDETIKFWDLDTGVCLDSWRTPRPYEGLNIKGIQGVNSAQIATLSALGAVEAEPSVIPMFARQRSRSAI